jgi:hypothetical protein
MFSAVDEVQYIITVVYQYFTASNKIKELESRIEGQEQYSRRSSLRFHNIKVSVDERGNVKHHVYIDGLVFSYENFSWWFFNPFLLLCTLVRVLYEINLTITWDLPSFTFPIMCDLPMSCKLISSNRSNHKRYC